MSKGHSTHPDVFFLYGRMSSVPIISLTSIQYRAEEICSHPISLIFPPKKILPILPTILDGFTIIYHYNLKVERKGTIKIFQNLIQSPVSFLLYTWGKEESLKGNCLRPKMCSWGRSLKGHCLYWILQSSAHIQENADSSECLWSPWCSDAVT